MDTISPDRRSEIMRRIRSKDTGPEMAVRRLLHGMGYRYRLHRKDLPGRPDIVFIGRRKAIFVHGCFWHSHQDRSCRGRRAPKSNRDYWDAKLSRNTARDAENLQELQERGWSVLVVWECGVKDIDALRSRLDDFMRS